MAEVWTAALVAEALITQYLFEPTTANLLEFTLPAADEDAKGYTRRIDLLSILCSGTWNKNRLNADREKADATWRDLFGFGRSATAPITINRLPCGWRIAFEIKISRSDFNADRKQVHKHAPISRCCNEFYFVAPRGVIPMTTQRTREDIAKPVLDHGQLPYGAGLIEVYRDDRAAWRGTLRARVVHPASVDLTPDTPLSFVDALARRTLYHRGGACGGTAVIAALRKSDPWAAIRAAAVLEQDGTQLPEQGEEHPAAAGGSPAPAAAAPAGAPSGGTTAFRNPLDLRHTGFEQEPQD